MNATLYDSQGKPLHPFHFQTVCTENLSPFWNESHADVDGGKMDRFLQQALSVSSTIDPTGTRAGGYYDQTDLPYYYELATQFSTSDRFFSPVLSNTNANRMYLFAGFIWPYPTRHSACRWLDPGNHLPPHGRSERLLALLLSG